MGKFIQLVLVAILGFGLLSCSRKMDQRVTLKFNPQELTKALHSTTGEPLIIARVMINVSGPGIDPAIFWVWNADVESMCDSYGDSDGDFDGASAGPIMGFPEPPKEIELVVPRGSGRIVQLLAVAENCELEAMQFIYADRLVDVSGVTVVNLAPQLIPGQTMDGDITGRYITGFNASNEPQGPSGEIDILFRPPASFSSLPTQPPPFIVHKSHMFGGWFNVMGFSGGSQLSYVLRPQNFTLFERLDGVSNPGGFVSLDDPYFNPSAGTSSRMRVRMDGVYRARCNGDSECEYEYRPPSRVALGFFLDGAVTTAPSLLACYPGADAQGQVIDWHYQSDQGPDFVEVSSGGNHTCGITLDEELYCWGDNMWGQIGDGTVINRLSPVQIAPVAPGVGYVQVSAGHSHTCAITTEDKLYCWGANMNGRLGDSTTTNRESPIAIDPGVSYEQVSAGHSHTCAITTGEFLFCWGNNSSGQLGDETTTQRTSPQAVFGGTNVTQVATGDGHTCALINGSLKCWGKNDFGQLGDETTTQRTSPQAVFGGGNYVSIAVGSQHSCGILDDGTLRCWGQNASGFFLLGQVGSGGEEDYYDTPQEVGSGYFSVSAGESHTCGIKDDGGLSLYCWGNNGSGRLGLGSSTAQNPNTPQFVGNFYYTVSLGGSHTCGRSMNSLKCWGNNTSGQLGMGHINTFDIPNFSGLPPFKWHGNMCTADAPLACVEGGGVDLGGGFGSDCTSGTPFMHSLSLSTQGLSNGADGMAGFEGPFRYRSEPLGGSVPIEIVDSVRPESLRWDYLPGVFAGPYGIDGVDLFATTDHDFDIYKMKDDGGGCDVLVELGLEKVARVLGPTSSGIENQQEYNLEDEFEGVNFLRIIACPFSQDKFGEGLRYHSSGAVSARWEDNGGP